MNYSTTMEPMEYLESLQKGISVDVVLVNRFEALKAFELVVRRDKSWVWLFYEVYRGHNIGLPIN